MHLQKSLGTIVGQMPRSQKPHYDTLICAPDQEYSFEFRPETRRAVIWLLLPERDHVTSITNPSLCRPMSVVIRLSSATFVHPIPYSAG